MRIGVIVNRGAKRVRRGPEELAASLARLFEAHGADADIRIVDPNGLQAACEEVCRNVGLEALVAVGGDGTVGCLAAQLIGRSIPLGVIAAGTLNHFARDAGIAEDPAEAVAVIARGHVRHIDAADVNGRVFLNNSSVGLYPMMVVERAAEGRLLRCSKRLAMGWASLKALRRFRADRLDLDIDGRRIEIRTPLLFVGNNRYDLRLLSAGRRQRLDRHELCLYAPLVKTRLELLAVAARALFGLSTGKHFLSMTGIKELQVGAAGRSARVAIDGETQIMALPLHYRTRPGAIRLIVPQEEGGSAPL